MQVPTSCTTFLLTTLPLTTIALAAPAPTATTTKPTSSSIVPSTKSTTRTPYPTSFAAIPTGNAEYAAMTASQHSAYCATVNHALPGYTAACINGVWAGLYGRDVAAAASTMVTVVGGGAVAAAAEDEYYVDYPAEAEVIGVDGGWDVVDEEDGAEEEDVVEKRNIANFFTKIADLFKSKGGK